MSVILSKILGGVSVVLIIIILSLYNSNKSLESENQKLNEKAIAFALAAKNNQEKADAYDNDLLNRNQRHFQDNEFKKVIRDAPESENNAISIVMRRALDRLPRPSGN